MLSKVLEKSTCASCKFCCSFKRSSLWETPLFPAETVDKLSRGGVHFKEQKQEGHRFGQMDLAGKYKTADPEEEAACEFLDPDRGCRLEEKDKPFDCKIWPLRIMEKDGERVIALTPTCPSINRQPLSVMEQLVRDGLGKQIFEYAQEHPYIVKAYKEGFPVLMKLDEV